MSASVQNEVSLAGFKLPWCKESPLDHAGPAVVVSLWLSIGVLKNAGMCPMPTEAN